MCKEYNNWSNYATWAAKLWIDNDQSLSYYMQELAEQAKDAAPSSRQVTEWHFTEADAARLLLAHQIQEMIEEANPLSGEASLYSDLLTSALGAVDWQEIAENILRDLEE